MSFLSLVCDEFHGMASPHGSYGTIAENFSIAVVEPFHRLCIPGRGLFSSLH